jgi:hypothetical protein
MHRFAGMRVIVHRPRLVRRSWRERLFSLPWKPWVREKLAPAAIGPDECYRIGRDTLVVGERASDDPMTLQRGRRRNPSVEAVRSLHNEIDPRPPLGHIDVRLAHSDFVWLSAVRTIDMDHCLPRGAQTFCVRFNAGW